ncbi:MAG: methyltransferase domain-containing protein [Gammaproteobacteria bacterium]|nr:methyltransferase domain-containing protein [Gammaproteobacteria bacterium]
MWDEKYSTDEYIYGTEPNDFLLECMEQIPQGRVLCLADGEGRNSVALARAGYQVTAVDSSIVGVGKASRLAADNDVEVEYIHADLAEYAIVEGEWAGIISIFCHVHPDIRNSLHQAIVAGLQPGGVLVLEAYTPEQLGMGTGGPPVAELTMQQSQLEQDFEVLDILHVRELQREVVEGTHHTGMGAVVQLLARK